MPGRESNQPPASQLEARRPPSPSTSSPPPPPPPPPPSLPPSVKPSRVKPVPNFKRLHTQWEGQLEKVRCRIYTFHHTGTIITSSAINYLPSEKVGKQNSHASETLRPYSRGKGELTPGEERAGGEKRRVGLGRRKSVSH